MIKKKIVVTGGLGFIASNLIEKLLKQNYKVINVDKISYSSNFYNIREIGKNVQNVQSSHLSSLRVSYTWSYLLN